MKNSWYKIAAIGLVLISLQSCFAQKIVVNREVDSQNDGKMLLGPQTVDQFQKEPYKDWFVKEHDEYQLDQKSIAELKKEKLPTYNLVVFVGTWCEDSHREFPRLMKILETVNYNPEKLEIIAVNRKKESPSGEEGIFNIQKVPTIIVKKYGKEVGRIIEMPETGYLERDLLNILKKGDNKSENNHE